MGKKILKSIFRGQEIYLPYTNADRLADVMALIQVLALDRLSHRSEDGLKGELQGMPKSASSWTEVAAEHPEFFRVKETGENKVSLVARHVLPKNDEGVRQLLDPVFTGKLIEASINIHDRQVNRSLYWRSYIPILVVVVAGVFTLFGVVLKSCIGG